MSSQNNKKSWTFVPKRSQPPTNKRATRRETTLRAFTFVQDWDPKISPIPPSINNASQKKQSHKKNRNQPTSSQSSESSIRESPVAQLVRSSPGPIIVSRRIPGSGNSSFKHPRPLSPQTPSVPSQRSSSSKQHSSSKSLTDSAQTVSGKSGVSPIFSVPRTRKQRSASKKRSPVSHGGEEEIAISPGASESGNENWVQDTDIAGTSGVSNAAGTSRLQESVIDNVGSSDRVQSRSSTAKKNKGHDRNLSETPNDVSKSQSSGSEGSTRSTRSRKRRGPSLTFRKIRKASLSFNKSISVLDSINETVPLDNEVTEQLHVSSASDDEHDEHQPTTTIPRKRQGSSLISKEGSAKGKTRQPSHEDDGDSTDVPVESDVPTPGSVRVSQSLSSTSDRSRSTSPRKRRGPKLTFVKKHKKKLSTTPQDGEVNTEIHSSSSLSRTGSRRKISSNSSLLDRSSPEAVPKRKSPSLRDQKSGASSARTPKGKRSSRSSRSDSSSSEADSRTKSLSRRGPRSAGSSARTSKGTPVSKKKKNVASKIISKAVGKTPDRSISFITATPKSGHVVRHQAKTQQGQQSGPVKAKGPAGQKKRVAGTESSEPGEPVEKRAKVRLYTTGARPRLIKDTSDLDILFNCLEDTAMEFREALDAPRHRKAVTKFMEHSKHELTDMISMQHDFKLQTLSLSRTNTSIGRYRNELLDLQRGSTRLDIRIAELKKEQENSVDTRAKALKGIDLFVSDLENLHETYISKYPKDIKSVDPIVQANAETLSSELEPRLELQNSTGSLSDKLREWLGSQVLQK
ncbi:serine/arginine repetitive matrix protein 1 [Strongylocentrotus purpuratus]|uniref:Centromere protein U n=1 Tax=Strongylocentrotus purpuratus TaxID=7668 RepID=A0A7M7NEL6_STRPU|nr:serine/arginine repetitive matrix protein 1 [Strongylocentrotus purpuratus]